MEFVGLLTEASRLAPPEAAALYAQAGIPVFPCVPGEKRPLTEHGFHDATTNLRTIRGWWGWMPEANIGIPTGAISGIDVVDIDRYAAGSGFAPFVRSRRAGLTSGWAALVRTPSGGIHSYYLAHENRRQSSWSAPKAHIDFRGDGGYILVPPSSVGTTHQRTGYTLMATTKRAAGSIDADRLHTFLDPVPAPSRLPHLRHNLDVTALARWVAARSEGERNRALFWAACRAAENGVPFDELHAVLGPAAHQAGLLPREAAATIRSALRTTTAPGIPLGARQQHPAPTTRRKNGPTLS